MSSKWFAFVVPNVKAWQDLEGKERDLTLWVFRTIAGPSTKDWPDDQILDAFFELIRAGLISVLMRRVKGGLEARLEFPLEADFGRGAMH